MNEDKREHLKLALEQNIRYDGRKSIDYRDVSITTGISATAEGSAEVRIGETVVIAGVKLEVGQPYADTPEEGTLMVGAELMPISSPDFEPGPPSIGAIELARVMDRAVRESGALDLKSLCIEPGEKVWNVLVDICTINAAGNLFDACSVAILAALKSTVYPEIEDGEVNYKKKTDKNLVLAKEPLSITVWKLGEQLILDPSDVEEKLCEARLTIGSIDEKTVCSLQKGGSGTLTVDIVQQMIDLSTRKADELRKLVAKQVK